MCGILVTSCKVEPAAFVRALALLQPRGPDASGLCHEGRVSLGHQRLKVLDLDDRSNQPFASADGRYVIVYNGEVYNYRELARDEGISLRTTCDTEVLVELYARRGPAMLRLLNGMFAFVILDRQTGQLFAARDRLGIKPLYRREVGGGVIFSSEISPILELAGDPGFDELGVRQYRKLRAGFNGRTIYRGIEMVPAGHYLLDGVLTRYWNLPSGEQAPPSDEELRALVEGAVRRRLLSDVPLGTYLSGGLDSTIITALTRPEHTWTAGFPEENEFAWSRQAAQVLGTCHHEVVVSPEAFTALAREMIRRRREPLSVPNEILISAMSREVKRANTVILSGEGADELFFGYDRIFRWAAAASCWDLAEFSRHYAYGTVGDLEVVEDALAPFVAAHRTPLEIVAAFFQTAHLHGLLRRLDDATMCSAVEARVPFVDHTLVERMAGVAFEYRCAGGVVKAPLKRVFADLVPSAILERAKVGFPVPLDRVDFGVGIRGETGMDRWLEFNLEELGVGGTR